MLIVRYITKNLANITRWGLWHCCQSRPPCPPLPKHYAKGERCLVISNPCCWKCSQAWCTQCQKSQAEGPGQQAFSSTRQIWTQYIGYSGLTLFFSIIPILTWYRSKQQISNATLQPPKLRRRAYLCNGCRWSFYGPRPWMGDCPRDVEGWWHIHACGLGYCWKPVSTLALWRVLSYNSIF